MHILKLLRDKVARFADYSFALFIELFTNPFDHLLVCIFTCILTLLAPGRGGCGIDTTFFKTAITQKNFLITPPKTPM